MSKNYELDRLKAEENIAFRHKQEAFQNYDFVRKRANAAHDVMQNAWEERVRARKKMNREFENRKVTFEHHDSVWGNYKQIRDYNNSRIESLKYDADSEHRAMQDCFDRASTEYEYGNKSEAPIWAQEGHEHKERRNELNAEISTLAQEVKNARDYAESRAPKVDSSAFEYAKNEFERVKSMHESAQTEFQQLKAESDRLKDVFDSLQTEFLHCKNAFQRKPEEVKSQNQRERDKILDKAKVHGLDRKEAKIVKKSDDTIQVYHGGIGKGDGFGHGHTAISKSGDITYNRKAFAKHGSQNFEDQKNSEWGPYIRGVIGNQEVTLREGIGENAGQTLICNGFVSGKQFKKAHNHYGPNDKTRFPNEPNRIEDSSKHKNDRYYTGPGCQFLSQTIIHRRKF